MNDDELLRYSRHILLHELGIEGQEKLLSSCALIIGAGGLGCAAALYLAASGVSRLILVDDDLVDLTNLQRQIGHTTERINQSKVSSLAFSIKGVNPHVQVHTYQTRANQELLNTLLSPNSDTDTDTFSPVHIVLDCSDNFATRQAVNAVCVRTKTPLISASALGMDGQLSSFLPALETSPCYACLFAPSQVPQEQNCATFGVFAPLVGVLGAAQALEALKVLTGVGAPLIGRLMLFNASQFKWTEINFKRDPLCLVCGT